MNVVSIKSLANHLWAQICYALSHIGVECVSPMPTFLSIEPASICQLACPQCPVGMAHMERISKSDFIGSTSVVEERVNKQSCLSIDLFRKILADCDGYVHTIQFFFQGEPLLNPYLPDMIRLAREAHIYTITSTNAQALTPLLAEKLIQSGLDRIIVSIDGLSEQSYATYRQGGSLQKALKGLVYLRDAKDRLGGHTHIELQCLRLKSNELEWPMFERSYHQMGADSLTLKSAQFYDYQHGNPLMPSNERFCRYVRQNDGTYRPKNRLPKTGKIHLHKSCSRLYTGCVITTSGDVLPCCFDKYAQHSWGSIREHSLRDIWNSHKAQQFRRKVRLSRDSFSICTNCTENE